MLRLASLPSLFALLLTASTASRATAQAPALIPVQGYLTDRDGVPVDGAHSITLRLYAEETGGSDLYLETHESVTLDAGVFRLLLGDPEATVSDDSPALSSSLFADRPELWLDITIGSDEQIGQRFRLASVPYALVASHAALADEAAPESSLAQRLGDLEQVTLYSGPFTGDGSIQGALEDVGSMAVCVPSGSSFHDCYCPDGERPVQGGAWGAVAGPPSLLRESRPTKVGGRWAWRVACMSLVTPADPATGSTTAAMVPCQGASFVCTPDATP